MITWNKDEIEKFLGGKFSDEKFDSVPAEKCDSGVIFSSMAFKSNGLVYLLTIDWMAEFVILRADLENADQACPAFELICRCSHIKISNSCYGGKALFVSFVEDEGAEPCSSDLRLALERLPNGRLYVWPVTGKSDPPVSER